MERYFLLQAKILFPSFPPFHFLFIPLIVTRRNSQDYDLRVPRIRARIFKVAFVRPPRERAVTTCTSAARNFRQVCVVLRCLRLRNGLCVEKGARMMVFSDEYLGSWSKKVGTGREGKGEEGRKPDNKIVPVTRPRGNDPRGPLIGCRALERHGQRRGSTCTRNLNL